MMTSGPPGTGSLEPGDATENPACFISVNCLNRGTENLVCFIYMKCLNWGTQNPACFTRVAHV